MIAVKEPKGKVVIVPSIGTVERSSVPYERYPLTYAPTEISAYGKHYILHEPLVCEVEDQGDFYCIDHRGLCIMAGSETWVEAKRDFEEWFVHTYLQFNELGDDRLSEEYRNARHLINRLVKEEL